jgi:hypothetical protein
MVNNLINIQMMMPIVVNLRVHCLALCTLSCSKLDWNVGRLQDSHHRCATDASPSCNSFCLLKVIQPVPTNTDHMLISVGTGSRKGKQSSNSSSKRLFPIFLISFWSYSAINAFTSSDCSSYLVNGMTEQHTMHHVYHTMTIIAYRAMTKNAPATSKNAFCFEMSTRVKHIIAFFVI